ncbi:MAG: hypothetical protein C0444_03550 [Microbacterium sp.]|nr:hypothetical protein [Microbacterium sp.]MBA4347005.1 hypothetical protein [Microbacterium sp.]
MSAVMNAVAPQRARPAVQRPALEVVPTRRQRRARPRAAYAVATVAGVFVILLTQLLLSIVLSDGAYRITALEAQRIELDRTAQVLTEQLNVFDSAQNVAANAESLGMVVSSVSPAFLFLSNGTVQGSPTPAGAGAGVLDGRGDLVGNVLLTDVPLVTPAATGGAVVTSMGVPAAVAPSGSLPSASTPAPSTGALPSPVTR